nr:MAG TPA: hypothetical protein [Caudoviricetes sp.]
MRAGVQGPAKHGAVLLRHVPLARGQRLRLHGRASGSRPVRIHDR